MNNPERRSRIPRTSIDVLREGERGIVAIRLGGGGLVGGAGRVSRVATAEEQDWGQIVARQNVFKKPLGGKKTRPELLYESDGRIECDAEVMEGYNGTDLGIILPFTGIGFTKTPFLRSKHDRPDRPVLYIPIDHNNRMIRLFLATWGDICDIQIADQMDVSPFFQKELHLPQLTTTHDPGSMYALQNDAIVTIGYNRRTY